jgi:hypothetical protein
MTDEDIIAVGKRIDFPSGHSIDVASIYKGEVCYHVWPPGIESQGMFDRARRAPIAEFIEEVRKHGGKRALPPSYLKR